VEQPGVEVAGFVVFADAEERADADAGVAGPGVAVVPVADPDQRGQGSRLSCPGPVARVPAAALPVEGRRSACLAAGSTRRPRKRARARSGRRNTSPGWYPPARSQRTPLTGSALHLRLPRRRATHTSPAARTGPRLDNDDRGPRTLGCGTGLPAAHAGWNSADDRVLPRHRPSTGCYRADGPAPAQR
jgi:hypothetical protein